MRNRLATETSPYLRQHAENPVDWYPWCEEAFRRARDEDKPVLLSVGYAACHWCHVMAHESFENPRIAGLMNERFISIKVDRQERPDLDEVYQKIPQMMGQGGGWPLTVFLTPQGEPFFGGTYFAPDDRYGRPGLARVLLSLSEAWMHRRQELRDTIEQFQQGFRQLDDADLRRETAEVEDLPAQTPSPSRGIRIRLTVDWAQRPSFPTHAPTTSCCASINELVIPRCMKRWSARSTAWRPAASMTSSAVGSPATVSMNAGPCLTSKRCSMTTASSSHGKRTPIA
ncbi:hypothetical protein LMG23994_06132 [Cupriavidus pinatubonensis]|uniref:Spermatogenesis-associated protein 20-like TRX domain-containing protein n=2 Tax=Cupriavidus pinatubonensis TaxID=248026 RepID=A0ABM8Y0M4_9BURK|nr:hypothetical protein LMG23994_06132 [Cupriavidus pinatubonensis]